MARGLLREGGGDKNVSGSAVNCQVCDYSSSGVCESLSVFSIVSFTNVTMSLKLIEVDHLYCIPVFNMQMKVVAHCCLFFDGL